MGVIPREGDTFGRYTIERQLGAGGMGVVHLALDTQMQRRVALKVMSDELSDNQEFLTRFHREAETLARLDSPHIVTIFEHGEVDGTPYLAMQYVSGGDLGAQLSQRGPLPVQLAARIGAQLAEALHDAHAAGVVHRDVKPANVLVRDPAAAEPFVYLGDFGIARAQTADAGLTNVGGVAGSWAYLAPERAKGSPATPASDVYALGCLLHACVTGRAPYAGSDAEMAVAHVQGPVPQLAGDDAVTLELNRIFRLALAKEPAERYASAADLRADLVGLAALPATSSPTSTSARAVSSTSPAATSKGRRRGLIAAGAAVAAVAAVLVGIQVVQSSADDDEKSGGDETAAPSSDIVGDWDGDGLGDVRVARSVFRDGFEALPAQLLVSDGSAFADGVEDAGALERPKAGDVDGDGRLDLVQVTEADDDREVTATVFRNTGDGVEQMSEQTFAWRTDYGFYGIGDFDGDGRADLVMTRNRGEDFMEVAVALSDGSGFDEPVEFASRGGRANEDDLFAIGDFDGDGLDDLAARVVNGKAVGVRFRVLISTGSSFRKMSTTRLGDARFGLADYTAADIDGDGTDELVHLITDRFGEDEYGGTVAVQRFVNGSFGTPEELVKPTSGGPDVPYLEVGASDVDGDGDEDVVRLGSFDEESETALLEVYVSDGDSLQDPADWGQVTCTTDGCEGEAAVLVGSE